METVTLLKGTYTCKDRAHPPCKPRPPPGAATSTLPTASLTTTMSPTTLADPTPRPRSQSPTRGSTSHQSSYPEEKMKTHTNETNGLM